LKKVFLEEGEIEFSFIWEEDQSLWESSIRKMELKALVEHLQAAEHELKKLTSEHQNELNRLSKELEESKERASQNDVKGQYFLNELTTWKDRALKAEGKSHQLANELKECEGRALEAEGKTQQLANELWGWKGRALKAEGHTGGFHSKTPIRTHPQVAVCLVNPSDSYIHYSYEDNGQTIQDFVVPGGKSEILCLVQQQYTISVSSGALRGLVRQVFHHDNHTLVLPNWLT